MSFYKSMSLQLDVIYLYKKLRIRMAGLYNILWWMFMPGVEIKVKWPTGVVIKEFEEQYMSNEVLMSADPNDHYRPWMENQVGKQGWDWNWGLRNGDISKNQLTIKFRKGKEEYATIAALRWS